MHALNLLQVSIFPQAESPQAENTFQCLKGSFRMEPVLVLPDPSLQFVVELDASDLGIGVVHAQRSAKDNKLLIITELRSYFWS